MFLFLFRKQHTRLRALREKYFPPWAGLPRQKPSITVNAAYVATLSEPFLLSFYESVTGEKVDASELERSLSVLYPTRNTILSVNVNAWWWWWWWCRCWWWQLA